MSPILFSFKESPREMAADDMVLERDKTVCQILTCFDVRY